MLWSGFVYQRWTWLEGGPPSVFSGSVASMGWATTQGCAPDELVVDGAADELAAGEEVNGPTGGEAVDELAGGPAAWAQPIGARNSAQVAIGARLDIRRFCHGSGAGGSGDAMRRSGGVAARSATGSTRWRLRSSSRSTHRCTR